MLLHNNPKVSFGFIFTVAKQSVGTVKINPKVQSFRKVTYDELTRGNYRNALIAGFPQQVLVSADDDLRPGINRSSNKLVIVRILADSLRQGCRRAHRRMHNDQIENALDIYAGIFNCEFR